MTGYVLTPAAQRDVDAIWDYTADRWGVDQAERYVQAIRDVVTGLAAGVRASRPVPELESYRKAAVGSHAMFFRVTDAGTIVVVRILHQKMDPYRHL